MNTSIKIFSNPAFGVIRTAGNSEAPLFCLSDICNVIGITNARNVKNRLDDGDVHQIDTPTTSGVQQMTFVNESGLYDVVIRSDSENAKPFRKWVTSEVLPAIRRTGGYMTVGENETAEEIMARAILLAKETIDRQSAQLAQQAPKVLFANAVETSSRSCLVAELAKIISQNGAEIGQNRLFQWMREHGYLCKAGAYYNQPTQRAMELGLFEVKQTSISKPDGTVLVSVTSKVTGKGQIYFVNKFIGNLKKATA